MLTIHCETARFEGAGAINCQRCQQRTIFPDGCIATILRFDQVTVVRDADSGVVLHDCRHIHLLGPTL